MTIVIPKAKVTEQDQEGFVDSLVEGVRSIPHLPDALLRGLDDPEATPEQLKLRRRALSEAALFVLTPLAGGGAGMLLRGMARPVIRTIIADAVGLAAGSAASAQIQGENPIVAGLSGAALGGAFGGLRGLAGAGAKNIENLGVSASARELPLAGEVLGKVERDAGGQAVLTNRPIRTSTPALEPEQLELLLPRPVAAAQQELFPSLPELTIKSPKLAATRERAVDVGLSQELTGLPISAHTVATPPLTANVLDPAVAAATSLRTNAARFTNRVTGKIRESGGPILEDVIQMSLNAFAPARTVLQRMGPAGTALASTLDDALRAWKQKAAPDILSIRNALQGFSRAEREMVGEVLHGHALPANERIATASDAIRSIFDRYIEEAQNLKMRSLTTRGKIRGVQRIEDYAPLFYEDSAVSQVYTKHSPLNKAAVKWLRSTSRAANESEAQAILSKWRRYPYEFRTGNINYERNTLFQNLRIPYEKDILRSSSRYIYAVRKRLEMAHRFGPDYRGVAPYYAGIAAESGRADQNLRIARKVFEAATDALPHDFPAFTKAALTANTLTMLSTAGVVQPAQLLNTAAVVGYRNMIKAIGAMTRKNGREWTDAVGAHFQEVYQDVSGIGKDGVAGWWVRAIGLEQLDKVNRMVSALGGRFYAEDLAKRFVKSEGQRGHAKLGELLSKLDIDPVAVLAQGGKLTEEQLGAAAFRVSTNTQFGSTVLDLPVFRNSSYGKLIYQFKPFALQQGEFLRKEVLSPMWQYARSGGKRGSLGPLTRYAVGIGPVGGAIGETLRAIKGRPAPEDPIWKNLENMALAGSFGLWYDTFRAVGQGPGQFISFFAGPTAGELTNFVARDVPALAQGKPEVIAEHAVRRIPLIGQTLANYWLFPR